MGCQRTSTAPTVMAKNLARAGLIFLIRKFLIIYNMLSACFWGKVGLLLGEVGLLLGESQLDVLTIVSLYDMMLSTIGGSLYV